MSIEIQCSSYMSWYEDQIKPKSIITFQYYYGFGAYPIIADQLFHICASMYDRWSNYFIDWSDSDHRIPTPSGYLEGWLGQAENIYHLKMIKVFAPTIHMLMSTAFQKYVLDMCCYYRVTPKELHWSFAISYDRVGLPRLEPASSEDSDTDTFYSAHE